MTADRTERLLENIVMRLRRGKPVVVPEKWTGKTTHKQTIRKRRSKKSAQARRGGPSHALKDGTWPKKEYREKRYSMVDSDA